MSGGVFVSYKRDDSTAVRRIVDALRAEGLRVWWDADISPNAPWEATIERELAAADAVIVCWSPHAIASENVKSEARIALRQGKLMQIFVTPCEPPLFFGEKQGVDLSGWRGDASDHRFLALVRGLRAILSGEKPFLEGVVEAKRKGPPIALIGAGAALALGVAAAATFAMQRTANSPAEFAGAWAVGGGCDAPLQISLSGEAIQMASGDGGDRVIETRPVLGRDGGWTRLGGDDGNVLELKRDGDRLQMRAAGDAATETAFVRCS